MSSLASKYSLKTRSSTSSFSTSSSKRKKSRKNKRFKLYKSIQALLFTKGIKVSVSALRKVPKRQLRIHLRKHFSQEEIAKYIPVSLVYSTGQTASKSNDAQSNQNQVNSSHTNGDNANTALNSAGTNSYHPPDFILDINEPLHPSKEITTREGVQFNKQIFSTNDDFSFDPGLWLTLPNYLPQQYKIPDSQFTSTLEAAGNELSSLLLQNQYDLESQVEPYYINNPTEINPTIELINNAFEQNTEQQPENNSTENLNDAEGDNQVLASEESVIASQDDSTGNKMVTEMISIDEENSIDNTLSAFTSPENSFSENGFSENSFSENGSSENNTSEVSSAEISTTEDKS